jgi:hypothetical protein
MASASLSEIFLRHATDCERMARASPNAASRAEWKQLAERARCCAALYGDARVPAKPKERRKRRGKPWSPIIARSTMN